MVLYSAIWMQCVAALVYSKFLHDVDTKSLLSLFWCPFFQVYRALKSGVQVVAAKVFYERDLSSSSSSSSSYAASRAAARSDVFKQEIAILKSCHDRNIVQFIGACLQPNCTLMVMEYLEGGDLYHAIANDSCGRFSWYKR